MASETLTPMMQQYRRLKAEHPDAIILFRCGDFYETYMQDAVTASSVLGITLTHRSNKGYAKNTEMAGFPHHALDAYLPKLIRAGYRVAICDQLEDPKLAKTIVKRGITEVVTPGVALGDNVLSAKENNFLAAVHFGNGACGLALLDISTGEFLTAEGTADYIDKLLANFSPKEVLVVRGRRDKFIATFGKYYVYELDDWAFVERTSREKLLKHFGVQTLKGFGIDYMHNGITAAGAILQYLGMTQHNLTGHITSIQRIDEERYVRLDKFTVRNLEIVNAMNEGGRSLLDVIDRTATPMGERLLRRWLLFPLRDIRQIESRQNVTEYFFRNPDFRDTVEQGLKGIGDIERLVSKIAVSRISPREMMQLRYALDAIVPIKQACLEADENLQRMGSQLSECEELRSRIAREIVPEPPAVILKGGVIADGVNAELDELRRISHSGKDILLKIQQREIDETGIPSLKIGFNNVFGYYIEVRNTYKERVPETWIRKQTLVNAERYITSELKELEEKILSAEDKILALEARLYEELVGYALQFITPLQLDSAILADIDCLCSFALAAAEHRYVRPVVDDTTVLEISQGRHPVIETQMPRRRGVCAQRHRTGHRTPADNHPYRPEHGRQVGPPAANRPHSAHGAGGVFRPGRQCARGHGRQDFYPRWGKRQYLGGRVDVHARNERGFQHTQQYDGQQSGDFRRAGARNFHVRRHKHCMGNSRIPARRPEGTPAHALCHALPRAERNGEALCEDKELQRVGLRNRRAHRVHAQAHARRHGPFVRYPCGAPGRHAAQHSAPRRPYTEGTGRRTTPAAI